MLKWGVDHPEEESKQSAAAGKAAISKPVKEEYDEQYQQELEILKQERAEVRRYATDLKHILSLSFRGFALLT